MTLYAKITSALADTGERMDTPAVPPAANAIHFSKPRWVPVEMQTIDNSQTSFTTSETVKTVEETRVLYTTTISDRPVTIDMVAAERERRLELGFDHDFGDARGTHHFATTKADMDGWDEVTKIAQALINGGQPTQTINILTATGAATVTAAEWQTVLLAAGVSRQPPWQASFTLQAMDPIPADFTDDSYWT